MKKPFVLCLLFVMMSLSVLILSGNYVYSQGLVANDQQDDDLLQGTIIQQETLQVTDPAQQETLGIQLPTSIGQADNVQMKHQKTLPDTTVILPEGNNSSVINQVTTVQKVLPDDSKTISAIENSINKAPVLVSKVKPLGDASLNLKQFGYRFFKTNAGSFASPVDVPVAPDYLLGAGDRIVLTLWGSVEGSYVLEVNRSGEIVLPKIGPVKVTGVPYGQLPHVIRTNLAKVFKDFQLNVTLGKTRLIKVYIVGEVQYPGDYDLSSLSTVIAALTAAGGPTKNGTLRSIDIMRNGKQVETVDLYDFFLKGDKSRDIRLQSGDTIFVPTIGAVAGIAGNVRRPGIYELKGENTLYDLLQLADGINSSGYLHRVQFSRVQPHDKREVVDLSLDPLVNGKSIDDLTRSIAIRDMDIVSVSSINNMLRNYVRLDGYVLRQGDYALKPGMRISDLLTKDNLLPEFYGKTAQLIRLFPPDLHPEVITFSPSKAMAGDLTQNLLLQEFDTIKLFSRWDMEEIPMVRVSGEVKKPGEYRMLQQMTVRDVIIQAGNLKRTAFMSNAEIKRTIRSKDKVETESITFNLNEAMKNDPKDNIVLAPYDVIMIRRIPDWTEITESYITLKGEFVFPGVYAIHKGERLDSVIKRAGGFTEKAYLPSAKFSRLSLQKSQQALLDETLAREELNLTKKQSELANLSASKEELEATKAALEGLQRTVDMLKKRKAEGRMVIKLLPEEKLAHSLYNFELEGGDTLDVSADPHVVSVIGQVYNQSSFLHIPGNTVEDYLLMTGSTTSDADAGAIYVIKADGTVVSRQTASIFTNFMGSELMPGDTVVVPQKIEKIAWMREIKDIATILGQLALSAGVAIAAGK